jgi:hypothetical protein
MQVEIAHIDECPNWLDAGARVRAALDECGLSGVPVAYRLIRTAADAAALPFGGSPTILIDGRDAFPSGGSTAEPACRIYLTESGLAGLPSPQQLREVFAAAAGAEHVAAPPSSHTR